MPPSRYALLLLPTLLCFACGGGEQAGEADPPRDRSVSVRVAESVVEELVYYDEYPGTVTALDEVEVRPQVAGYITGVHFREGDFVRKGQRLFTVDVRRYVAEVEQAQSQVGTARANLELAEKNVARYRRLAEAEAIALQTLDQAEAELTARRRALESAEAGVRSARTQLDYTVIHAPLSGVDQPGDRQDRHPGLAGQPPAHHHQPGATHRGRLRPAAGRHPPPQPPGTRTGGIPRQHLPPAPARRLGLLRVRPRLRQRPGGRPPHGHPQRAAGIR